jgi:hypothetical protein
MGEQGTELPNGDGRNPYFRDEICSQEMSQTQHIVAIRFDPCFSDPLHLRGMSDDHTVHKWKDQIVDVPGVGGGFDDDIVCEQEVSFGPGRELIQGDAARVEHDLLETVYTTNNEVMLVKI